MAKGKVTVKSLRAGQTVYRVCGSGTGAFLEKLIITSRAFKFKKKDSVLNGTLWVNYKKFWKFKDLGFKSLNLPESHCDDFSLSDAGIDTRRHTSFNRTFYKLKAAQRWLAYVHSQPRKASIFDDDDDLWDCMDGCAWDHGNPDE